MKEKLAKVTKASLEIKERGILNFWIFVDYDDGLSQGVGGICLDTYDEKRKERVGTAYGCEMIRQLLLLFNVNCFSEMKGKTIYVIGEGEGLSFKPIGIRIPFKHENKTLIFEDVLKNFEQTKGE